MHIKHCWHCPRPCWEAGFHVWDVLEKQKLEETEIELCTIVSIEGQRQLSCGVYYEADRDDQKILKRLRMIMCEKINGRMRRLMGKVNQRTHFLPSQAWKLGELSPLWISRCPEKRYMYTDLPNFKTEMIHKQWKCLLVVETQMILCRISHFHLVCTAPSKLGLSPCCL